MAGLHGGAALIFLGFNAVFASFYWIGNQPISNVPGGAYAVISNHDGKPTLMVRFANERHNIIGNAAAPAMVAQE
jgi:hypothetical protein